MTKKTMHTYLAALAMATTVGVSACSLEQGYPPLQNQIYIAQTETSGNVQIPVTVGKSTVQQTFNIRISHPTQQDITVEYSVDDQVIKEYNTLNQTELEPLPTSGYKLPEGAVQITKGEVNSAPIPLEIMPLTQELKDTGKTYAIGLKLKGNCCGHAFLPGADRVVYVLKQQAIQPVVKMNSSSNLLLPLNEEKELINWTVEYLVNIDKLGTAAGQLNNQALFGAWGSGSSVNGVKRDGEIYTRFGDAFLEGNRFQVKTKGTQINSKMSFKTNTWYHIAVVCENTKLYLYVDGELDNTLDLPAGSVWMANRVNFGNTDYLKANVQVAQLRLWSVARTPKQLKENMYSCPPSSTGLFAYWKFDEGNGDIFKDATGKNPDASVKNDGHVVWVPDVTFGQNN